MCRFSLFRWVYGYPWRYVTDLALRNWSLSRPLLFFNSATRRWLSCRVHAASDWFCQEFIIRDFWGRALVFMFLEFSQICLNISVFVIFWGWSFGSCFCRILQFWLEYFGQLVCYFECFVWIRWEFDFYALSLWRIFGIYLEFSFWNVLGCIFFCNVIFVLSFLATVWYISWRIWVINIFCGTFFIFYEDGETILVYFGGVFIGLVFDIQFRQNSCVPMRVN